MKIYISGKIGEEVISDATRQKFARAEEMLKAKGYEVFNPVDECWQEALNVRWRWKMEDAAVGIGEEIDRYDYYLLKDMLKMAACDAVYFLADWQQSPGATAEYYFAKAVGKRMFFEDRHDACEYLIERMYAEAKEPSSFINKYQNDMEIAYFTKHFDEAWLPIAGKEGGV